MARPYFWWHGYDLAAFVAALNAKGLDNVRVEFHPDTALLYVKDNVAALGDNGDDGFDFSHSCPPDCP